LTAVLTGTGHAVPRPCPVHPGYGEPPYAPV